MELSAIRDILRRSRRVLFITGAGVSADSGLPTYRGVGGLYNDIHPEEGLPIEVLLSGPMFQSRPELTWKYLHEIERACRGAKPNRAHEIIAALEEHIPHVLVLTQNVDGFHREAGSSKLIDIHGDLHLIYCVDCNARRTVANFADLPLEPRCTGCGGWLRPDVVLFEELLPINKVSYLRRELEQGFDAVFSVGTSSGFPYIAGPVWEASAAGVPTVEINPGHTEVSSLVTHRLRLGAAEAMEKLWEGWT